MPDVFGFETPEESLAKVRDRFAESRARVVSLGRNASPGVQLGSSLSQIFGPSVQKALDTRAARKEERARLMQTQNMSKEEAKEAAKATIDPQFAEVRKANRMQEIAATGSNITDALLSEGIPEQRARAVGMFEVAQRLDEGGFNQEATSMRVQAGQLLEAQHLKEAELSNLKARTGASEASSAKSQAELAADDDTYLLVDDTGAIKDSKSMPITDPEGRQKLRDAGYVNVGNSSYGVQFNRADFAGAPKEVGRGTQEDIIGGLNMLSSIDVLRSVSDQTGFIEGPTRKVLASLGIDLFDNDGFIDAVATRKKMRADIQSIIKGIPSNYDAGIFEQMIPDPGAFKNTRFYNAQLDVLERSTKDLVELTIAFHQGTQKPIPKAVLNAAYAQGVRVNEVEPMTAEEVRQVQESPDNNVFTAHQRELEVQAELFRKTQGGIEETPEQVEQNQRINNYFRD